MIAQPTKKQPNLPKETPTAHENINYKTLYLQCKQNVGIFMKQVDKEISNILHKHEQEKKQMQQEIQSLKTQLKQQSLSHSRNPSVDSFKPHSEQQQNSSLSKTTVEQYLNKFTGLELRTKQSEKTISHSKVSVPEKQSQKSQFKSQKQKENTFLPSNLYKEELNVAPLQPITNLLRRQKRLKEKKSQQPTEKADSVKDFLKNIRGKLNNHKHYQTIQQQNRQPIVQVISPGMFTTRSNKA